MDFNALFNDFNLKNVLIVGDSMIDAYMWGEINRISPEAPVSVVEVKKHENTPCKLRIHFNRIACGDCHYRDFSCSTPPSPVQCQAVRYKNPLR